ncbi:DUF2637 domain-containing protein [Oerskovia enterophila]|uniref:DUF2637 domain-containing protein n=1 Tax=Oerskovia enterophila TaxID=43678 RepID=A0ABX2Y891_9CELL|nr:DUF2637 domain-containing protein [Oerskovia enterophila]OCI32817.1 hypothetical protein OERS_04090 [Oerskovia enterophila]
MANARPTATRRPAPIIHAWVMIVAHLGTMFLIAASFILSFDALTDLAVRAGINPHLGFLWPLIVDGLIVVSSVAIIALVDHPRHVTFFPWMLLFAGAGTSIAANATHAILVATEAGDGFPLEVSALVASVPPLVLLAVTHLLVILMRLGRPSEPAKAPARARQATKKAAAPKPAPVTTKVPARAVEVAPVDAVPAPAPTPEPEAEQPVIEPEVVVESAPEAEVVAEDAVEPEAAPVDLSDVVEAPAPHVEPEPEVAAAKEHEREPIPA